MEYYYHVKLCITSNKKKKIYLNMKTVDVLKFFSRTIFAKLKSDNNCSNEQHWQRYDVDVEENDIFF